MFCKVVGLGNRGLSVLFKLINKIIKCNRYIQEEEKEGGGVSVDSLRGKML